MRVTAIRIGSSSTSESTTTPPSGRAAAFTSTASVCDAIYPAYLAIAPATNSFCSISTRILSVTSNPESLRIFWMRFINSRATPSARSSSVSVMSSATVSLPSDATSHPGMSSEVISKSAGVTVIFSAPRSSTVWAAASIWAIRSCENSAVMAAICFMYLP